MSNKKVVTAIRFYNWKVGKKELARTCSWVVYLRTNLITIQRAVQHVGDACSFKVVRGWRGRGYFLPGFFGSFIAKEDAETVEEDYWGLCTEPVERSIKLYFQDNTLKMEVIE